MAFLVPTIFTARKFINNKNQPHLTKSNFYYFLFLTKHRLNYRVVEKKLSVIIHNFQGNVNMQKQTQEHGNSIYNKFDLVSGQQVSELWNYLETYMKYPTEESRSGLLLMARTKNEKEWIKQFADTVDDVCRIPASQGRRPRCDSFVPIPVIVLVMLLRAGKTP
jgi:hypothetical protein